MSPAPSPPAPSWPAPDAIPVPALLDPAALSHALARVDAAALRHNAECLARVAAPSRLMAVVKADAYGHGAVAVARTLAAAGIDAFAVATLPEALALRAAGVAGRVLPFLPPPAGALPLCAAHGLDVAVSSDSSLAAVVAHADAGGAPLRVHVKVDTGMHRMGFAPDDVPAVLDRLASAPGVEVAAVWSHLATSEDAFAATQAARLAALDARAPGAPRHVANSAALLSGDGRLGPALGAPFAPLPADPRAPHPGEAWVRAGLALYGLDPRGADAPAPLSTPLRPVLTLSARVLRVVTLGAGETVSYGRTWTATRPTRIATVGLGYADGLPRALSNRGWMGAAGQRLPIAGVVCMDLTMLDLGPPGGPGEAVREGDWVDAVGGEGPSAHAVADVCGTIPYEIVARIGARVPRVVTA